VRNGKGRGATTFLSFTLQNRLFSHLKNLNLSILSLRLRAVLPERLRDAAGGNLWAERSFVWEVRGEGEKRDGNWARAERGCAGGGDRRPEYYFGGARERRGGG